MGLERFTRKSFGFVVVILLGLAIYFQAAGAVELVASNVFAAAPAGGSKVKRVRRSPALLPTRSLINGDSILARNPFDAVTGPVERNPVTAETPQGETHVA